jgi:Uma2 family endonuclease
MAEVARRQYSYQQYLSMLQDSQIRLEYLDGEVFAMSGGTPTHSALCAQVIWELVNQFGSRCRVHSPDLKVFASGLTTFPDASVVCGQLESLEGDKNVALNPVLLVEVTSPSTEAYDRGPKLKHYQGIASLQAVLFVSHRTVEVTVVERERAGWKTSIRKKGETFELQSLSVRIAVDTLYRGVTLE